MTPTRLQEIRQWVEAYNADADDLRYLLTLWDTHQTALRALVEQWKQEAKATDKAWSPEYAFELCADQLERLLTPEQS